VFGFALNENRIYEEKMASQLYTKGPIFEKNCYDNFMIFR